MDRTTLAANLAARAATLRAERLRIEAGLTIKSAHPAVQGPAVYLLAYAATGR